MRINAEKLREFGACQDGLKWFTNLYGEEMVELEQLYMQLICCRRFDYLIWLLRNLLTEEQHDQFIDKLVRKYCADEPEPITINVFIKAIKENRFDQKEAFDLLTEISAGLFGILNGYNDMKNTPYRCYSMLVLLCGFRDKFLSVGLVQLLVGVTK